MTELTIDMANKKPFIDWVKHFRPNNKHIEIRAIVDMEVVIYLDEKNNYHMEPIHYFNVLCRCNSLKKITNETDN
jgi:hypothetical protein